MYFIIVVVAILFLPSVNSEQPDSQSYIVKNGLICTLDNGEPFTGKVSDVVNTQIIEYDVVNGIKDGEFNVFSESGKKLISGAIKKNKNEGLWQYFYPDGPIESEGYFKNDAVNGDWYWYYPSGKLKATGNYIDGKKNGKWTVYDEYGKVLSEKVFRNDAEVVEMKDMNS